MAFFKLKNPKHYFFDIPLSIQVQGEMPFEIADNIISERLNRYINTTFLVSITKNEYERAKAYNKYARNDKYFVGIKYPKEVVNIYDSPTSTINTGYKVIVGTNPTGAFLHKPDYVATLTESGWVFTKPYNGLKLLVDDLGIMATYHGNYPTGKWDYIETIESIIDDGEIPDDFKEYILSLIQLQNERMDLLQAQINAIITPTHYDGSNIVINNNNYTNAILNDVIDDIIAGMGSSSSKKHIETITDWEEGSGIYYKVINHNFEQEEFSLTVWDSTTHETIDLYYRKGNLAGGAKKNYCYLESMRNIPVKLLILG